MKKTYTIQTVTHAVISPEKGSIIWHLLEPDGRQRKVNGITEIDKAGLIDSARSVYAREAPLVEALLPRNEGETFEIDFTEFNRAQGYINREIYADIQRCEKLSCLMKRVGRVLAVVGVVVVLWLGWTFYNSANQFAQKQPLRPSIHELP
ncbi:MAG TPA: hypothetical protein PLE99_04585 [Candidatus Thiothrix moscowensis]|uniref:hypothetical protein n=1 Tax=unclassified Thiothrix TaxID=2636184 RepID=UPI0025E77871|nr:MULTISPECIES: hypothetical protein [unclassified Thiothrix]HRJ52025.1 hypothetical protein [Candidatus Thiothrix moscowensis]HRJ92464.1 hypothetical protein [Candidatus Thiothrix moscowensis]